VLSLYCGAGGIDEGLRQSGIKTTLAIDIWKDASETFKLNHPDSEVITGKVSDYLESFSDFDIVVGGPPCPDFSRCNPNRKFNLCEVNNFWSVVDKIKPKFYLMENVQDMKTFLFKKHYLVDVADYGVAQNRLRCIFTNLELPKQTHQKYDNYNSTLFNLEKKKWLGVKDVLNLQENEKYTISMNFLGRNAKELTRSVNQPIQTITTFDTFRLVENKIYSKKYHDQPINKKQGRKLRLDELKLLQGFNEKYVFTGTEKSQRKQIGNAVPPPLIKAFFSQIILTQHNHSTVIGDKI